MGDFNATVILEEREWAAKLAELLTAHFINHAVVYSEAKMQWCFYFDTSDAIPVGGFIAQAITEP
jgi:hypothetical protein